MHMITGCNVGNGMSYVFSVFEYGISIVDCSQGKLVSERNGMVYGDIDGFVGIHDPARKTLSGVNVFHDNDAYGIFFVMD